MIDHEQTAAAAERVRKAVEKEEKGFDIVEFLRTVQGGEGGFKPPTISFQCSRAPGPCFCSLSCRYNAPLGGASRHAAAYLQHAGS